MLTHRRTWPNEPNYQDDYLILDDGLPVGRIYRNTGVSQEQWLWFIQVHIPHATRSDGWRGDR